MRVNSGLGLGLFSHSRRDEVWYRLLPSTLGQATFLIIVFRGRKGRVKHHAFIPHPSTHSHPSAGLVASTALDQGGESLVGLGVAANEAAQAVGRRRLGVLTSHGVNVAHVDLN